MQGFLRLVALLVLAAAVPARAHHQDAVDLRAFHGLYRGTVAVTLAGRTYPGTARIFMQTTKHGHSATMAVSGQFQADGKTFSISNYFTFLENRRFTERSITNGFPGTSVRVAGKYIAHARKLAFQSPFETNTTSGASTGRVTIRPGRHGKQILALTTSVALDGQHPDYLYDFQVSKYLVP
jgi:hypothetical protein